MTKIDEKILAIATQVQKKRPKTVIDHIIKHGFITTEELKDLYGYNHPPRAIRDVREEGIPLETFKVNDKDGRKIGAYKFGDPSEIEAHKLGGRKVFSKAFKKQLIDMYGSRCAISSEKYEERYLQIDHRLPYEIAGDGVGGERQPELFMLLSGAAQRQKSWSCEHCKNFKEHKDPDTCKTCYWAYPEEYTHIAMKKERRIDVVFLDNEIALYEKLQIIAKESKETIQSITKKIIAKFIN